MRMIVCLAFFLLAAGDLRAMTVQNDPSRNDLSPPLAWLEDVHGAPAQDWVAGQNRRSLGVLKADPRYQRLYDGVLALLDAGDRIAYGRPRGAHVYNFWQDGANPKGLWRRTSIAAYRGGAPHWEVLLDVDALAAAEDENWVFKGADCAPGGRRCLIKLSRGGGDAAVVREFDVAARTFVPDGFALAEAKSSTAWLDDDTLLFASAADGATRSGYARSVKLWRRGTALAAARTVYEGQVEDVLVSPAVFHARGGTLAVIERAVTFFETEHFLLADNGTHAERLSLPRTAQLHGFLDGALLFTLREGWQVPGGPLLPAGALAGLALRDGQAGSARLLYAPGERASIESVAVGRDAVYAAITENVIGAVHVFRPGHGDWAHTLLTLPDQGTASIVAVNEQGPEALLGFENYLTPPTLYFDGGDDAPRPIQALPARFDAAGLVTEQFQATSADGTLVPYFVTRPKNLKGPAPTLLYGYGGFEVSLTPAYSGATGQAWLARGGIHVVANIRGGGELGPRWHQAALKENRQKAFDDFAAVAADLQKRGLTTPRQLGIMGGSNGGLLVATVMVQHPELVGAVVCQVPLIDMLAFTRIGAGASWVGEYGDPADPAARAVLAAYSPYQNVKPGVAYPPVFFVTATSDDRVSPVHARKMAAKMQAQGHDVLFYENTDGGHAGAADHRQRAEMSALSFVYLARRLGLE